MTAKVASPDSLAEDLACRGPLKAKRLLYTEDQLSFKVSKPPQKKGILLCVSFIWLVSAAVLVFTYLFTPCALLWLTSAFFPPISSESYGQSAVGWPAKDVFSLSPHPTRLLNPSWL